MPSRSNTSARNAKRRRTDVEPRGETGTPVHDTAEPLQEQNDVLSDYAVTGDRMRAMEDVGANARPDTSFNSQGTIAHLSEIELLLTDPNASVPAVVIEQQGRGYNSDGSSTIDTPPTTQHDLRPTAVNGYDDLPALIPVEAADYDNAADDDDDGDDGPPPLEPITPEGLSAVGNNNNVIPVLDLATADDNDQPALTPNAAEEHLHNGDDDDDGPPPLEPAGEGLPFNHPAPDAIINPEYLPENFIDRLRGFVEFADVGGARFAVAKVPNSCTWGVGSKDDYDLSKFLCYDGQPVSIWLTGRVKSLWFYTLGGDPHDKVNIGIVPLRELDCLSADRLLNSYSRPVENASYNTFYAGKLMLTRSKGDTAVTPAPFTKTYDALEHYGPKSTMRKISPAALGKHDVVLVECFLTRWKAGERAKRSRLWTTWRCGFELNSVSLLFSTPDTSTDIDLDLDVETAFM